jgi:hypothetical protein
MGCFAMRYGPLSTIQSLNCLSVTVHSAQSLMNLEYGFLVKTTSRLSQASLLGQIGIATL